MFHTISPKKSKKNIPHCQTELGLVSGLGFAGAGGMQMKNKEIYFLFNRQDNSSANQFISVSFITELPFPWRNSLPFPCSQRDKTNGYKIYKGNALQFPGAVQSYAYTV